MLPLQERNLVGADDPVQNVQHQLVQTLRSIDPQARLQVVFHVGFVDVLLIASCKANLQFVLEQ